MMFEILMQLVPADILGSSVLPMDYYDDDESGPIFWLAGPIGAVTFYSYVYLRYRNTDKRHAYEYKTASKTGEITGSDTQTGQVKGVKNSNIPGGNSRNPRQRLGQGSSFTETWKS